MVFWSRALVTVVMQLVGVMVERAVVVLVKVQRCGWEIWEVRWV